MIIFEVSKIHRREQEWFPNPEDQVASGVWSVSHVIDAASSRAVPSGIVDDQGHRSENSGLLKHRRSHLPKRLHHSGKFTKTGFQKYPFWIKIDKLLVFEIHFCFLIYFLINMWENC